MKPSGVVLYDGPSAIVGDPQVNRDHRPRPNILTKGNGMTPSDLTYNGWTNYETWAVGMYLDGNYTGEGTYEYVVELVQGCLSFQHLEGDGIERQRVADYLKDFLQRETDPTGWGDDDGPELHPLISDLLGLCLARVNWYELADAWITNVTEQAAAQ